MFSGHYGVSFAAKRVDRSIALVLSCVAAAAYVVFARPDDARSSVIVGLAALSHWVLDRIVHVHDLLLFGDSAKVGLGLWNAPIISLALEGVILFGGMWIYLRGRLRQSLGTIG